jgi:pimeloyl-ACP methyl ester carboxylesterase
MNATEGFEKLRLNVNGTDTVVLAIGDAGAPPLVFFHGAGTFHGWEFARPWAAHFRVLIPHHPGFAESGDMEGLREFGDFVLHYGALFDQLGLHSDVNLVGFSLGGRLAARFAISQQHRLRRLVLVAPVGLRVPDAPMDDFFRIRPEELPGRLVKNIDVLRPWLPSDPHDLDFTVDRYRETRTVATVAWDEPFDRVIPRWMKIMTVPTLVMWSNDDALVPVGQATAWAELVPDSELQLFDDAGHLLLDESATAAAAVADFCK